MVTLTVRRGSTPSPKPAPTPTSTSKCDEFSRSFFRCMRIGLAVGTVVGLSFCFALIEDARTSQAPPPISRVTVAGGGMFMFPFLGAVCCGMAGGIYKACCK